MGYLFGMKVMTNAVVVMWVRYGYHDFKKIKYFWLLLSSIF